MEALANDAHVKSKKFYWKFLFIFFLSSSHHFSIFSINSSSCAASSSREKKSKCNNIFLYFICCITVQHHFMPAIKFILISSTYDHHEHENSIRFASLGEISLLHSWTWMKLKYFYLKVFLVR